MAHACLPKLSDTEEQLLCGGEAVESERDDRPISEGIAIDGIVVGPVRSPFEGASIPFGRFIDSIVNGGTASSLEESALVGARVIEVADGPLERDPV